MFHASSKLLLVSLVAMLPILADASTLEIENEIVKVPSLAATTVTLAGKAELHLTERSPDPFPDSQVRLDSPDSWLFFTHVVPSKVVSDFLERIRVDGAPAVLDENVRIVQHELGAVVIPHSPNTPVVRLHREPDFGGSPWSLVSGDYYPGLPRQIRDWGNAISSFTLRRGYMMTLAEKADGTGASRVYIAQDGDLEVAQLPEDLNNRVNFIRVLPWRWVSKKGYAGGSELPNSEAGRVNAAWFYNWNIDRNSSLDREYVAIQQTSVWPSYQGWVDKPHITHYMGYNEPNAPDQDAHNYTPNPENAINQWPKMMRAGYRIGSPAVTDGGRQWLYQFMDMADANDYRVDYIVIHFYQWDRSANDLKNWLREVHERTGRRPIWLKEFNNGANWTAGPPTRQQNAQRIGEFIQMMDDTPWIERYSVYSRVEWQRYVFEHEGDDPLALTAMGRVYRDQESPIGYIQEFPAVHGNRAHYRFEGNVRDSSEDKVHAMHVGAPSFEAGVHGQALRLDEDHDHVQLPANFADSETFSFAGWVKWDGGPNWQRIFSFGDAHNRDMSLIARDGQDRLRFQMRSGGNSWDLFADALTPGEWTHVAVTIGSRRRTNPERFGILYVNGVEVDRTEATILPLNLRSKYHYLGRGQAGQTPIQFSGLIDDVHIRNEVIRPGEILSLASPVPSYETWAAQFDFPTNLGGPLADANGDGIPNGLDYLLGTNPLIPHSGKLPTPQFVSGSELGPEAEVGKTYLAVEARVRRDATGVALIVRGGDSLEDLSAAPVKEAEPAVDDGDFRIHTYFHAVPIEDSPTGRGFLRLDVEETLP